MVRETSIECYNELQKEGVIALMERKIYNIVYKHGPCTSGEAYKYLSKKMVINPLSQSRARFTKLVEKGVFKELPKRPCKISGRKCLVYDVTGNLPIIPEKIERTKPIPRGFAKSISFIIWQMNREGKMFVSPEELKKMLES